MNVVEGKVSFFGGKDDVGMKNDTGLALYEPKEADLRPDLFYPAIESDPLEPTWRRLKTYSCYLAFRYDHGIPRKKLQHTPVKVINPKTGQYVMAWISDWGPHINTGRFIDLSPQIGVLLGMKTDDVGRLEYEVS